MGRAKQEVLSAPITDAIGYLRVSTSDQADSGLGLEAQRRRIEAYCTAQGWNLVEVVTDAGVSAKTLRRPGLLKAIGMLYPGRTLVSLKLDRLTRTARDLDDLSAMVAKQGGEWATVEGQYDTASAMGRFMLRLVSEIAQLEREVTAERTTAALAEKKSKRERLGTTPLGYRTVQTDAGAQLVSDEAEQETVRMARELRAAGLTLRAIAARLASAGRTTKRGGRWQPETIAKVLRTRYAEELAA
jgi:DNA invertase Pin-like site-specific DNA recombinase